MFWVITSRSFPPGCPSAVACSLPNHFSLHGQTLDYAIQRNSTINGVDYRCGRICPNAKGAQSMRQQLPKYYFAVPKYYFAVIRQKAWFMQSLKRAIRKTKDERPKRQETHSTTHLLLLLCRCFLVLGRLLPGRLLLCPILSAQCHNAMECSAKKTSSRSMIMTTTTTMTT